MPDLIAKSPLAGIAPLTRGGTTLAEGQAGAITSIAPYPGRTPQVGALLAPLGLSFPEPNRVVSQGAARILWAGREMAFLIGAEAPAALADHAAMTDQSDGWALLTLAGPMAEAALMRPVPLDLRLSAFPVGRTTRAPLNHMQAILTRTGAQEFEVMVFRSMARTAWAELAEALEVLEARAKAS
ncbi:sarcosine oxidase subunit gamma [Tabrizicola sp. TH137]|uniref:sarcosine oxidase subunit gamma n=1 Tax=Tabrizicola sp. TH137 TaxID=2067452 RepID=UPI000C7C19F1|nr:sarcosine oxidase subunit gamma family protein [Tabrizicola sp. TH137]PLL11122.1 sarcosine oxidase subunit gamma [Tabrizicola sp. TH137]